MIMVSKDIVCRVLQLGSQFASIGEIAVMFFRADRTMNQRDHTKQPEGVCDWVDTIAIPIGMSPLDELSQRKLKNETRDVATSNGSEQVWLFQNESSVSALHRKDQQLRIDMVVYNSRLP